MSVRSPNRELIEQRKTEQAAMTPAQRAERIRKRDAAATTYEQQLSTPDGRATYEQWRRAHERKFVPQSVPQIDKVLSLAASKVNITAKKLTNELLARGYTMTIHDVRRFVRDTLQVTLRSERGKRTDLGQ